MDLKQEIAQKEAELKKTVEEYNKLTDVRNNMTNQILKQQGILEYLQQQAAGQKEAAKPVEEKKK